ncbi:unnamed protein product, partial [Agarophyton chilense]
PPPPPPPPPPPLNKSGTSSAPPPPPPPVSKSSRPASLPPPPPPLKPSSFKTKNAASQNNKATPAKPPRPGSAPAATHADRSERSVRRFGRRKEGTTPDENTRRAALSSKSFRNRLGRGANKESLLTKAQEVPEDAPSLPDVSTDKTEAARKKLETHPEPQANLKSRRKGKRQHSSLFGKRSSASAANTSSDTSDSVEEGPKVPAVPAPLDILRTARIPKKMFEGEITHKYAPVQFTPFGQDWATDSFALVHNAIKAEIRELQNMAYVMQKRKMLLTLNHIDIFYDWWNDFSQFLDVAITIEEEVYYGWVGSKDYLRGPFKKSERMRVYGATRNTIQKLNEYKEKFLPYLPVGERLEGLLVLITGFDQLLQHHSDVAKTLPNYLQTLFNKKEKEANLKEIVSAFRNSDGYNRNLVLLAKWMPDRMMKRWALSHMRTKDLISFKGWRTMITREHCNLAMRFEDIIISEEDNTGEPVIGAAMAINEEMREHIDNNRSSDAEALLLPAEQLEAYYASEDSCFQPQLAPAIQLAFNNFVVELTDIRIAIGRTMGFLPPQEYTPPDCLKLSLDDAKVLEREQKREQADGVVQASPFVNFVYTATCRLLDVIFKDRPIPRFWVLETVARMPYFAYSSCLHLFSTLGWYRSPTLMNVHHAEELNEAYHLAVMESLGGDRRWFDRFLAFHVSLGYYWFLVVLFMISPTESYRFSQKLEGHAVDTYSQFLEENESRLRELPVPDVAYEYFDNFLYYFQEFQISDKAAAATETQRRSPKLESLYDVFESVVRDEMEHTQTMDACSEYILNGATFWYNGKSVTGSARKARIIPLEKRQQFWRKWEQLNANNKKH